MDHTKDVVYDAEDLLEKIAIEALDARWMLAYHYWIPLAKNKIIKCLTC